MRHHNYRFDINNPYCLATVILAGLLIGLVALLRNGTFDDMTYLGRSIDDIIRIAVRGIICLAILYAFYLVLDWWFNILVEQPKTKISREFYNAGFMMMLSACALAFISFWFYLLWIIAGFSFLCMFAYAINCRVCKASLKNPVKHKGKTYCQGCLDSLKEDFGTGAV